MTALSIIVGTICLVAILWLCWHGGLLTKPPYPEDKGESERAALETAQSIRDYLRPEGETLTRSTDFGDIDPRPHKRAGSTWNGEML